MRKLKKIAVKCFTHLVDVQTVLGLTCIMPMLQLTQSLMKYAQKNDVFVYDFLAREKILQKDLNDMYKEEHIAFMQEAFWDFNGLFLGHHDEIPIK
jgi:predicted nuclease of restriction endonuclease-like (RecB) superfamily